MAPNETIYILGSGAVGFPLAVYLSNAGRNVVAVRTSRDDIPRGSVTVTIQNGTARASATVETISLARLTELHGMMVIAAKSYANERIAQDLKLKAVSGPIVIMQNGLEVEKAFSEAHFAPIYRCVLYVTGQARSEREFIFRPVTDSRIGIVDGDEAGLMKCVAALSTEGFPFSAKADIRKEVWKKAIINSVFNSICPLLEVDNGIFSRDDVVLDLAREVVGECLVLTDRLGLDLSEAEVMAQIILVSKMSDGQLISTLQDIRPRRETEIESLNLAIGRAARALTPPIPILRTEVLGKMILAKSRQTRLSQ